MAEHTCEPDAFYQTGVERSLCVRGEEICIGWNVWVSCSSFSLHQTRSAEDVERYIQANKDSEIMCMGKVLRFGLSLYASTIVDAHFLEDTLWDSVRANCVQSSNTNANIPVLMWIINTKQHNRVIVKQLFGIVNAPNDFGFVRRFEWCAVDSRRAKKSIIHKGKIKCTGKRISNQLA